MYSYLTSCWLCLFETMSMRTKPDDESEYIIVNKMER